MWSKSPKFCPQCSSALGEARVEGRLRPACPDCDFVVFLNPASAAAAVVRDPGGRVLLIRRRIQPFQGHWALPAGYQELDESPLETVEREVREETGIAVRALHLLELLHVPDDPRRPANVAVYLCAPLPPPGERTLCAGDDAREARWFPLDALPERLGFRNNRRILEALRDGHGYPGSPAPRRSAADLRCPPD